MTFIEALDRFEQVQSCYKAISDLTSPHPRDLLTIDRNDLATLFGLLNDLQNEALKELAKHQNCTFKETVIS